MYSAWATKRRSIVLFWISIIGLGAFSAYIIVSMYRPPSCFDRKMNQEEVGVDCGGPCARMCNSQILPMKTLWARTFEVSSNMWSALSYTENPNPTSYAKDAKYIFRIYDSDEVLIKEVEGSTYITHDPILPVFHGRIDLEGLVAYRTEFEWVENPVWYRVDDVYEVVVEEKKLINTATKPEIQATLLNKDPYLIEDIEVVAILYGVQKNAIASSKTYVDMISPRGKRNIAFSWPHPFSEKVERIQIIVRVPPQEQ